MRLQPSKHDQSNYEALWLQPACSQPESGWIAYAGSNSLCSIRFRSSKEGTNRIMQNWPRCSLEGLVRFWQKASCLEASHCAQTIGHSSGRIHPARSQIPTFRLGCVLQQIILCKTSLDPIWFWPTVLGLGQMDPVQKQAGQCF